MSSRLSAFNWRGQPSIFASDVLFAGRQQCGDGVKPEQLQPVPGTRFPGKSINTQPAKVRRLKGANI